MDLVQYCVSCVHYTKSALALLSVTPVLFSALNIASTRNHIHYASLWLFAWHWFFLSLSILLKCLFRVILCIKYGNNSNLCTLADCFLIVEKHSVCQPNQKVGSWKLGSKKWFFFSSRHTIQITSGLTIKMSTTKRFGEWKNAIEQVS